MQLYDTQNTYYVEESLGDGDIQNIHGCFSNKFVVQENYIFNHNYILTKVKFGNDKSRSRETSGVGNLD